MKFVFAVAIVFALVFSFALVGCGVLSTLQVIVEATSAAVPIMQAAGVPIPPAVPLYVAAVAGCIAGADTSSPTTGQLGTIAVCLAQQIAPEFPPGLPSSIGTIIAGIAGDVAKFLAQNEVQSMKDGAIKPRPLTDREAAKFHSLTSKAKATVIAARKLVRS